MARDARFSEYDLTLLARTVTQGSQRTTFIGLGIITSPIEPLLYYMCLRPSGEVEVVIDIPSLNAMATLLAQKDPGLSLFAFYDDLLENAPYETLQTGQTLCTRLPPQLVSWRVAFLRKHQWRVIRPES